MAIQAKLASAAQRIVATQKVATKRIAATRKQVATKISAEVVPFTTARRIRKLENKITELQDTYAERERMFKHARHLIAAKALFADFDDSDRLVIYISREIYDIRIDIRSVNHRLAILGDEVKRLSPMAWELWAERTRARLGIAVLEQYEEKWAWRSRVSCVIDTDSDYASSSTASIA